MQTVATEAAQRVQVNQFNFFYSTVAKYLRRLNTSLTIPSDPVVEAGPQFHQRPCMTPPGLAGNKLNFEKSELHPSSFQETGRYIHKCETTPD